MRLMDFFIRISLQGTKAAADLRRIAQQGDKARASLDRAGNAAHGYDRRLGQMGRTARTTTQHVGKLLRGMRVGLGGPLGGGIVGGLTSNLGPLTALARLHPAATAAAVALGGFAAALISATPKIKELQDKRADIALALPTRNEDGSQVTREQRKAMLAEVEEMQRKGVSYIVEGRNVLANTLPSEIGQAVEASYKAGFSREEITRGDVIASFVAAQKANPEAAPEDIGRLLAKTKDLVEQSGISHMALIGKVSAVAAATEADPDAVIRALPVAITKAKEFGQTLDDVLTAQILTMDKFPTERQQGRAIEAFFRDVAQGPRKALEGIWKEHNLKSVDENGAFVGWESFVGQLTEMKQKMGNTDFQRFLTKQFDSNTVTFLLGMMEDVDKLATTRELLENQSQDALNASLSEQFDTLSESQRRLDAAQERWAMALDEAGFDTFLAEFNNFLTDMVDFATAVMRGLTATSEAFGLLEKGEFSKAGDRLAKWWNDDPAAAAQSKPAAASVEEAGARAQSAKAIQSDVIKASAEVESVAADAQERIATFKPMLDAAEKFAKAMPLWARAARLGVKAEMLQMLVDMYSMSARFELAGMSMGTSFNRGLQTGFNLSPALAPAAVPRGAASTNTTINNQRYTGVPTREIEKATRQSGQRRARGARTTREGKR